MGISYCVKSDPSHKYGAITISTVILKAHYRHHVPASDRLFRSLLHMGLFKFVSGCFLPQLPVWQQQSSGCQDEDY